MKKYLDILSIVLPLILIIFAFLRVDGNKGQKTSSRVKLLNGLTLLIAFVLLLIGGVRYLFFPGGGSSGNGGPRPVPMTVGKHSEDFNNSVNNVMELYYKMNEGFVNWDTVTVNKYGNELTGALANVRMDELQKDTTKDAQNIYLTAVDFVANAKTEASNLVQQPTLDKKREALNSLTDNLRNLLITVKYDRNKIYYQECPMAFGDDKPGNWLSPTKAVRNPYLGNKHPEYKDMMVECGGPKDTINFMPVDTTTKVK